jgi:hypothetical protein
LRIEHAPSANPFAVQSRRGEPLSTTELIWISGAAVTGVAYDVVKARSIKVWHVLEAQDGAEKVPAIRLHWYWQAAHCKYSAVPRRSSVRLPEPHRGQLNPWGQRHALAASSHCSSFSGLRGPHVSAYCCAPCQVRSWTSLLMQIMSDA